VRDHANIQMLVPYETSTNLHAAVTANAVAGMKTIIALNWLVCDSGGKMHPDWLARLARWRSLNPLTVNNNVEAFYLPDEPYANGWSAMQLLAVSDKLKSWWPATKQMLIEATGIAGQLGGVLYPLPAAVHYVGISKYDMLNASLDTDYNIEYAALKSRMGSRRMVVVADTQWSPKYGEWGVSLDDMAAVFEGFYAVAQRAEVDMLICYVYPNAFDGAGFVGTAGMPIEVKARYKACGRLITGR
jgi:hypothetical protein